MQCGISEHAPSRVSPQIFAVPEKSSTAPMFLPKFAYCNIKMGADPISKGESVTALATSHFHAVRAAFRDQLCMKSELTEKPKTLSRKWEANQRPTEPPLRESMKVHTTRSDRLFGGHGWH